MGTDYNKNVFINCPYDKEYRPMKQALMFAVKSCGFTPLLVSMDQDGGTPRIIKIKDMICNSKYGIHDISRCKASSKGEWYRMNMPFEMGLDLGCHYFSDVHSDKKHLVLTTEPYSQQPSLSDLSGNDPKCHEDNVNKLIRHVRNFLYCMLPAEEKSQALAANVIRRQYDNFQSRLYMNYGSDSETLMEMEDDEYCAKIDEFYKGVL